MTIELALLFVLALVSISGFLLIFFKLGKLERPNPSKEKN